jgi:hypothetical protein
MSKAASSTGYGGLASKGARLADAPLSGSSVAAVGAAIAGTYAANTAAESVNSSVGSQQLPSSTNPISLAENAFDDLVTETALSQAGVSLGGNTESGLTMMGVSATTALGAAGGVAGVAMTRGSTRAMNKTTSGKNAFAAPEAKSRTSFNYAKRQGARLGNAAYRSVGTAAAGAAGLASAAATIDVVDQTVTRLAKKVMKTGTPGSNLSSNNVLDSQKRMKQTGATTGVSTYAGQGPGVMDGSTVLALHKTGGSGGVLR